MPAANAFGVPDAVMDMLVAFSAISIFFSTCLVAYGFIRRRQNKRSLSKKPSMIPPRHRTATRIATRRRKRK